MELFVLISDYDITYYGIFELKAKIKATKSIQNSKRATTTTTKSEEKRREPFMNEAAICC